MELENLNVYVKSLSLAKDCWIIYERMDWRTKKIIGDQFIRSVDSIGTNIAEGFGRYHFLDKIKFFYNSRGSLYESKHWVKLLKERNFIEVSQSEDINNRLKVLSIMLNNLITVTYKNKEQV